MLLIYVQMLIKEETWEIEIMLKYELVFFLFHIYRRQSTYTRSYNIYIDVNSTCTDIYIKVHRCIYVCIEFLQRYVQFKHYMYIYVFVEYSFLSVYNGYRKK